MEVVNGEQRCIRVLRSEWHTTKWLIREDEHRCCGDGKSNARHGHLDASPFFHCHKVGNGSQLCRKLCIHCTDKGEPPLRTSPSPGRFHRETTRRTRERPNRSRYET